MISKVKCRKRSTRRKQKNTIKYKQYGGTVLLNHTNIPICIYAHSDVFDVLSIQFDYLSKLFNNTPQKIYLFSNKNYDKNTKLVYETILYNDEPMYTKRLQSCIEKVKENYLIIIHEKNILLKYSNEFINKLVNTMQTNNIDSIDLKSRRGCLSDIKVTDTVSLSNLKDKDFTFNLQPRLWKRTSAIELFSSVEAKTYRNSENDEMQSAIKRNQNTYGLCSNTTIITTLGFDVIPEFIYMPVTHYDKFIINPVEKIDKIIEDEYNSVFNKYIKNSSIRK
jgi:hypothetical protein